MKQLKLFKSSVSLTLTLTEPERVGSLEIPGVSVSFVSKELKASVEQQKDKEASGQGKIQGIGEVVFFQSSVDINIQTYISAAVSSKYLL